MAENAANSNPVDRRGTNKIKITSFRRWHRAGFTDPIVPIIPVGATLSPASKIPPENVGKVPGIKRENGWVGFADWTQHDATLDDLRRWYKMGASVGLQTRRFPAVDLDIDDKRLCREIEKLAYEKLGPAPCRTRTGSAHIVDVPAQRHRAAAQAPAARPGGRNEVGH